ncbi:LAMI_0E13454g1_1 [Lachancea mirantina]|uniref:Chromatin modification-related protein EAF1 n=1 Tax=Lachancea mirantina TaxID=1230905 RepID=A0A1G4JQS6_9SACH|nr:LAMI_0E13454g1_1 [Lachancea mirantina]
MSQPAKDDKENLLENLVAERARKLTELYCLSRLQDFLTITNNDALEAQIKNFLDNNNIQKGLRFNPQTVPEFNQAEAPADKKTSRSKSGTPVDKDNVKKDKEASRPETETGKGFNTNTSNSMSSLSDVSTVDPHKENDSLVETTTVGEESLKSDDRQGPSETPKRPYEQGDQSRGVNGASASLNAENIPPQEIHNNLKRQKIMKTDYRQVSAVGQNSRKRRVVDQLLTKTQKNSDLYDPSNINSKGSVYLVMNNNIPLKLPQAIPLAELKYVAQTLPLVKLMPTAHKALTTEIMNAALNEGRIAVVSSRIEELRRVGLWSLRQPRKFIDPWGPTKPNPTHWQSLLTEAKWMQCDFYEGKKYKMATCAIIAQAVMDYWNYGKACCVERRIPGTHISDSDAHNSQRDKEMSTPGEKSPFKELEPEEECQTIDTGLLVNGARKFGEDMQPSDTVQNEGSKNFKLPSPFNTQISLEWLNSLEKKMFEHLPIYAGIDKSTIWSDSFDNLPFEPVSKATVTLDDDHFMKIVERQIVDDEPSITPFSKRRGMFYGNRRSHYLRPPKAPSLRYLRYRTPTIWLPEDDSDLVKNINTFAYNWELISAHLSPRPNKTYASNIERRTPWQCFERFIQLNEKFQFTDMKGPRAHAAQLWLIEAHKLQQQQKRRISPLGVGEESIQRGHRRLRWASMFEAMRKCMKKRENAPKPNPSQPRKPLDCKNTTVPTPAEMSQLKAQRDEALRRDMQMRRLAKHKLQAAALLQQQQLSKRNLSKFSGQNSNSTGQRFSQPQSPSNSLGSAGIGNTKITAQALPKQRPRTSGEREIIENYVKKILLQKPDLTPELALRAAESYYRSISSKQQIKDEPGTSSTHPSSPGDAEGAISNLRPEAKDVQQATRKLVSPTPQEILQKLQHGK